MKSEALFQFRKTLCCLCEDYDTCIGFRGSVLFAGKVPFIHVGAFLVSELDPIIAFVNARVSDKTNVTFVNTRVSDKIVVTFVNARVSDN